MDRDRFLKAKEILIRALERQEPERPDFLLSACAGDEELLREVRSLLAEDEAPAPILDAGFMHPHVNDPAPGEGAPPPLPDRIGPYEITGLLGEGGMGLVYRGRQLKPIKREVAVKVLRRGLDTDRILQRFAWERRSLARMDHPHIARILDAGSDDQGRPFVVLELIEGMPITRWCEEHDTPLAERIDLVARTCRAVQHAHDRGILHRDLKPNNVMIREIDGEATPCIIDFGIAKAIDPTDMDLTMEGQRIGTPAYMSPEQLAGDADSIDVRSDVYALGVILYELLAGVRPYPDRAPTPGETQTVPLPPSQAAGATRSGQTTGSTARTSSTRLRRKLRGDLDRICLMAIRAEPDRRYASASSLAEDLVRFQEGRPVTATPDHWFYRTRKGARRHPVFVTLLAALLIFTVSGVSFLAYHVDKLDKEQSRARAAEAKARAEAAATLEIAGFLEGLFTQADPTQGGAGEMTAQDLLDQGIVRLDKELLGQPEIRGRLYSVMGRVHHGLAFHERGIELLEESLESFADVPDSVDVAEEMAQVYNLLGNNLHDLGRYAEAETAGREALRLNRMALGDDDLGNVTYLADLAVYIQAQGNLDQAQDLLEESIRIGRELGPPGDAEVAWSQNILGYILFQRGRYHRARDLFSEALAVQQRLSPGDNIDTANYLNNLGGIEFELGNMEASRRDWTAALEMWRRIYPEDHPGVARAMHNLSRVDLYENDLDAASRLIDESLAMNLRVLGPDHPNTLSNKHRLAQLRQKQRRLNEAEALYQETLEKRVEIYGPDNRRTLESTESLGRFYLEEGQAERSLNYLVPVMDTVEAGKDDDHPQLNLIRVDVAAAYLETGRRQEALVLLQKAVPHLDALLGVDDPRCVRARKLLARAS